MSLTSTNPSSSVTRYVCDNARCYHSSDLHLRVSHLTQLVGVEESCAEAVELGELLLTLGELEHHSLSCSAKPVVMGPSQLYSRVCVLYRCVPRPFIHCIHVCVCVCVCVCVMNALGSSQNVNFPECRFPKCQLLKFYILTKYTVYFITHNVGT